MPHTHLFNGDFFRFKSLEDYSAFMHFSDFVNNKEAINAHINSYEYMALKPSLHHEDTHKDLSHMKMNSITSALNHFAGLTITSLCTTFEITVKEFLRCYFIQNPSSMYEFIGKEDNKGLVSLKEMLKVDTYQDLMNSLAEKAASSASKGKYGLVLSKIAKLCKEDVDSKLVIDLNQLQAQRNKIVHEKLSKDWNLGDIEVAESTVSKVIEQVCRFGLKRDIPGLYSCVDNKTVLEFESFAVLGNEKI
ncbi:HEPN domain-containing protein [Cognaticolwellia mytili]|uniref:HEPN domain-containing protein n=1 Tax=Cognaticolwellia mytili TaxID=1888913 RepID=UPI000A177AF4|nr:HEPN domain-containing protein [Cognaticolwellia mytili]